MDETPTILLGGQRRQIADVPTGVLVALFARWSIASEAVAMVRELRKRGNKRAGDGKWTGWLLARMNRIDPPPCACGRVGLYMVGTTTYCAKCKTVARIHRLGYCDQLEAEANEAARHFDAMEAQHKKRDGLAALHVQRQRRRRPSKP